MIQYVEPLDMLRHKLPLRHIASSYGVVFDTEGHAVCPFHDDSRPSLDLYVSDDGTHERWICFPCRALGREPSGGDVFSMIMRAEDIGFVAAVERARLLARDFEGAPDPPALTPRSELDTTTWESVLAASQADAFRRPLALEAAGRFPPGAGWAAYLVEQWGWGLSEDGWALVPHREASGTLTGIKLRPPSGGDHLSVDGSRYRQLYGAWRSQGDEYAIICEGETDTVWAAKRLRDHGINVLGLPGASIQPTKEVIAPLHGLTVFVCLDGDDAGRAATERWAAALVDGVSASVWVCSVPDGHDLRTCDTDVMTLMSRSERRM